MAQVSAMCQVQTHEGVTWLQYCQQYSGISLCARVRLHVGILGTKEFAYAVDGQLLYFVYHLATAIIALSVFVSEVRAHSFHYLVAHKVLTGNQLDAF